MKERSLLPMSLPTFDAAGKETGENQGVKKNGVSWCTESGRLPDFTKIVHHFLLKFHCVRVDLEGGDEH